MAHEWPKADLYPFPLLHLFLAVLWRVRKDKVRLLLVAHHTWFSDLISLLEKPPLRIPITDNLSHVQGLAMALLSRDMETMGLACEQGTLMDSGLSSDISEIILNASVTDL